MQLHSIWIKELSSGAQKGFLRAAEYECSPYSDNK